MIFDSFESRLAFRVFLLFLLLCATAYVLAKELHAYLLVFVPGIIYMVVDLIRFQSRSLREFRQFMESVKYRDFSRHFETAHAPSELRELREDFNEINAAFKAISKEKETQYHYLQQILELVGTGILSYKLENGEVMWMNESLKKMLQVPYLRSIHSLGRRDEALFQEVEALKPGQSKVVTARLDASLEAQLEKTPTQLLISATAFQSDGQKFKLIAFQNVHEALDENESRAWNKLLSVMTHEIMNSVAPISSLADTLKNRLQETALHGANPEDVEDLEVGISTIKRRSEGLLKFAETYRNLNKITTLTLDEVCLRDQFFNLQRLMQPTLAHKKIALEIVLKDPEICLMADANLLDQVLINLLVNAIEALKDRPDPKIVLSAAHAPDGKTQITIADNGAGMPEEVKDKIFIPFFSTKKQGSGIGLSLCKQIVMLHKGSIQVQSAEGVGTKFIMRFG